jgi:hypothetical protein
MLPASLGSRFAPVPFLALGLALAGCRGGAPDAGGAEGPAGWAGAEIAHVLVRCGFRTDSALRWLSVEVPLEGAPEGARLELRPIFLALPVAGELGGGQPKSPGARSPARRLYWIGSRDPQRAPHFVLEELDASRLRVVPLPPEGSFDLESLPRFDVIRFHAREHELLRFLRRAAFEGLRRDMVLPRRPLESHFLALAGFVGEDLGGAAAGGGEERELRSLILEQLEQTPEPRPLVVVLFEKSRHFEAEELEPFAARSEIPLKLLPLVREAALGSRPALQEVITLSLEYFQEAALFDAAVRALFPADLNAALHARGPARAAAAESPFLQELRLRLEEAVYVRGRGWSLPG